MLGRTPRRAGAPLWRGGSESIPKGARSIRRRSGRRHVGVRVDPIDGGEATQARSPAASRSRTGKKPGLQLEGGPPGGRRTVAPATPRRDRHGRAREPPGLGDRRGRRRDASQTSATPGTGPVTKPWTITTSAHAAFAGEAFVRSDDDLESRRAGGRPARERPDEPRVRGCSAAWRFPKRESPDQPCSRRPGRNSR